MHIQFEKIRGNANPRGIGLDAPATRRGERDSKVIDLPYTPTDVLVVVFWITGAIAAGLSVCVAIIACLFFSF